MSQISVILEADEDGTLHIPLPPELRQGKLSVMATIEPLGAAPEPPATNLAGFGCLRGKIVLSDDFDAPLEDFREYME